MRLFVSLPLPAPVRSELAAALAGVRTTAVDRWHVTLAFLGDQPSPDPLLRGLTAVAAQHRPFALHLRGAGSLSSTQVAGVDGDLDALHALASDVATACRDAGVELERRRYRPHVTVSRAPAARARLGGHVGSPWTVSSFDLVHSTLGKQVRHDVVQRFALGGQRPQDH